MKIIYSFFVVILFSITLFSQSVGVNDTGNTPDASAMLDVESTTKGLLIPRMTIGQKTSISNPANGLLIYQIGTEDFWYNGGTSGTPIWKKTSFWTNAGLAGSFHNSNLGDLVGIGLNYPSYPLHLKSFVYASSSMPLMAITNDFGVGNTSMIFTNSGATNYTIGVDVGEVGSAGNLGTFKIVNGNFLNASTQGDATTMIRSFPTGITDINNQSRCRVYQQNNQHIPVFNDVNMQYGQPISYQDWIPVFYDFSSYDQHNEFTLVQTFASPFLNGPSIPPSLFTAKEEGYYQVNARVDFFYKEYILNGDPEVLPLFVNPVQGGYVSIGIVKTDINGTTLMYSQGNKLMYSNDLDDNGEPVGQNNLAPNVSDVVYLQAGESVSIWVWQSIFNGIIPLRVRNSDSSPWGFPPNHDHPSQVYVSIHKSS